MIVEINKSNLLISVIVFLIAVAYLSLLFLPKDNPIEQTVEKVIKETTGIKVDLTPGKKK